MRTDRYFCPCKCTLAGRVLAFFSYLLMIGLLLFGSMVSVAADSFVLGILFGIPAVAVFLLLQAWAAKIEAKHNAKSTRDSATEKQTAFQHSPKTVDVVSPEQLSEKKQKIEKCMDVLRTNLTKKQTISVRFMFPDTQNIALLTVTHDAKDPAYLRLITKVHRENDDLCMMNYMERGTLEELQAYLADKKHAVELLESIQHLSDRLNERM